MIKKQLKLIVILLCVTAVLLIAYFVAKPFVFDERLTEQTEFDKDGDRLGTRERPYVYDVIEFENLKSIYVHNKSGEYRFNMDSVAQNLVLEGKEELSFDAEKLAYLYVNTCKVLAMTKVENPSEDLSEYGLSDGVSDVYFEVVDKSGEKHTVYIGDVMPTGAAYYCKSAEKPHIYIIDTMIENCVLKDENYYVVPLLAPMIPESAKYEIQELNIVRDGKVFVSFEKASTENVLADGTRVSHNMTYPAAYNVSQELLDEILTKLVAFVGDEVIETDIPIDTLEEIMEKYGFTSPSAEIVYTYSGKQHRVIFGDKTEDGSRFYVLNTSQRTILTVPVEDVPFVEGYDLIKFIDNYMFQMDINNVKSVRVTTRKHDETFNLTGEKEELSVTRASKGEVINTRNFRQFYIDMLLVKIEDYSTAPEKPSEILSYTVETRNGAKHEYRFYDMSTRKVFFTVNGVGQFYVGRDVVDRVISNLDKLLAGETVISAALE